MSLVINTLFFKALKLKNQPVQKCAQCNLAQGRDWRVPIWRAYLADVAPLVSMGLQPQHSLSLNGLA